MDDILEFFGFDVFFTSSQGESLRVPINQDQIKLTLANYYNIHKKGSRIRRENVAIGARHIATIQGNDFKFFTCSQLPDSQLPFYKISQNELNRLRENGVKSLVLIFWESPVKGVAPTFTLECGLNEIDEIYWYHRNDSSTYHLNFKKAEESYVNTNGDAGRYTFLRHGSGTQLAKEVLA